MDNQALTVEGINCVANNNINEVSIAYTLDGVKKKVKATGFNNMLTSKNISVYVEEQILDQNDNVLRTSKWPQYNVSNATIYDGLYNGEPIPTFKNGETQYLHALNGMVARITDLGGDPLAQNGHQPWDETDGSLKAEYVTP